MIHHSIPGATRSFSRVPSALPGMLTRYASCREAGDIVAAAGGRAQTIHLPEDRGIAGNTHLMMQDSNNTEIGEMILEWLRAEFGGSG